MVVAEAHPQTCLSEFIAQRNRPTFDALWQRSQTEPLAFWQAMWAEADFIVDEPSPTAGEKLQLPPFPYTQWWPTVRLNYAENILHSRNDEHALVVYRRDQRVVYSRAKLYAEVSLAVGVLTELGVGPGDIVSGLLPNSAEAVIIMLATAAIGAVWSLSAPPAIFASDNKARLQKRCQESGIAQRLLQLNPKLVICMLPSGALAADWANCLLMNVATAKKIFICDTPTASLPAATATLLANELTWQQLRQRQRTQVIHFQRFPFNHPLLIYFSAGTSAAPKAFIHGHGGMLLQHRKEHQLHCELTADSRLLLTGDTEQLLWQWSVSAISLATLVLIEEADSSLTLPRNVLVEEKISHWLITPSLLLRNQSVDVHDSVANFASISTSTFASSTSMPAPNSVSDPDAGTAGCDALRYVLTTNCSLRPEDCQAIHALKKDVAIINLYASAELLSCFAISDNPRLQDEDGVDGSGSPAAPIDPCVLRPALGICLDLNPVDRSRAHARNSSSATVANPANPHNSTNPSNQRGYLACRHPFPGLPLGMLNDWGHQNYLRLYFRGQLWCMDDVVSWNGQTFTVLGHILPLNIPPNECDSPLALEELYQCVERHEEISRVLMISAAMLQKNCADSLVLFVAMNPGYSLNATLIEKCRADIAQLLAHFGIQQTMPMPIEIIAIAELPNSYAGKLFEQQVAQRVVNRESWPTPRIINPDVLGYFQQIPALVGWPNSPKSPA